MRPTNLRKARKGYTILELVVVLAVLIILGATIIPTLTGSYSNTRQKAAADLIRSRVVEARAKAMEQGVWYRVAINKNKTSVRVAPDGPNFSQDQGSQTTEDKFEDTVTAEVNQDSNNSQSSSGQSSNNSQSSDSSVLTNGGTDVDGDWVTVITVGPEGICKEDFKTVTVKEAQFNPLLIQVRGVVGSAGIIQAPKNGSNK